MTNTTQPTYRECLLVTRRFQENHSRRRPTYQEMYEYGVAAQWLSNWTIGC